jgi:hypothetical protein
MQTIRTRESRAHIAITFHARDGSRTDVIKGGRSLRPELTMNLHHVGAGEVCSFPAKKTVARPKDGGGVIDEWYFLAANGA